MEQQQLKQLKDSIQQTEISLHEVKLDLVTTLGKYYSKTQDILQRCEVSDSEQKAIHSIKQDLHAINTDRRALEVKWGRLCRTYLALEDRMARESLQQQQQESRSEETSA